MDEIIRFVFDPGIREWEYLFHEEFYVLIFDPGGYGTFHSFICVYFNTYVFMFLGSNFVCIVALVTNLVCFVSEVFGLRVKQRRVDVNRFLSKGVRTFEFPECDTKELMCAMSLRALIGRKHKRVGPFHTKEMPDVDMLLAGVGVLENYSHILTCISDNSYIFHMLSETCDYKSFDATNLVCLYAGTGLWTIPFREEEMSDLRTNPFEEEGNDDRLTGSKFSNNLSTRASRIQQMISSNCATVYSRMLIMELNSSNPRGGDEDILSSRTSTRPSVDPMQVPVGPVTRARAKRFKEGLKNSSSSGSERLDSPCSVISSA